ncbi:hypothetical protein crov518 [Cafeteria roenbergensis virus]|uniref:Uncharacterized protein n=1 Tax=Cafeteria roenbergensis virus (strain BV-PW1) TaxID=693272 RepID=E3T5T9_CROVB|nr:hypothetical protein crov518 [Cafeteria roenbergensis virus BV-PW1]ADO67552.1 hypothetical protein crov518 [Cafeteria roenbergensis virus BV-PW1]
MFYEPVIIDDYKNNKYQLLDGNHICYACNELGFEYIYAFYQEDIGKIIII